MSMFPETPRTLLRKIAELARGDDAAVWADFVECYRPAVRRFIELQNRQLSAADLEDAVQDIFIKLVELLRQEKYDPAKARFRTFLALLMRRTLIDRYRSALAHERLEQSVRDEPAKNLTVGRTVQDPGVLVDLRWRQAVRQVALDQLLANPAIADQTRAVYRAYVVEEQPIGEVASRFQMTNNAVAQVKRRLDAALAALEQRLG